MGLFRFLKQRQLAAPFEPLQDLQTAVHRAVVGGDDPVHPLGQMEAQHALEDVGFIPAEQCEHQHHFAALFVRLGLSRSSGRGLVRP